MTNTANHPNIEANKTKLYKQFNAQPDGKFHWTTRYKKILAELEESKPLEATQFQHTQSWSQQDIVSSKPTDSQQAVADYIDDVVAGKKNFEQQVLNTLLANTSDYRFSPKIYHGILSCLSDIMSFTELLEVMVMGMWHKFDTLAMDYDGSFPLSDMSILLQQHTPEEKTAILTRANTLIKTYPIPAVRIAMFFLFPDAITLTKQDKKLLHHITDDLTRQFTRFFNCPDVFGIAYAHAFPPSARKENSWSEPYFLLMIKHRGVDVIHMVDVYFQACAEYSKRDINKQYRPKVRKNLKLLEGYHHVDVLDFLLTYAYQVDVITAIAQWVTRYPLFTLKHLITRLPKLRHRQRDDNVKAIIANALNDNPLLIAPLKASLTRKTSLDVLETITRGITVADIQAATDEVTENTSVDDSGIPPILCNDDWQKATRKRKIEIASAIRQHELPSLIINKTEQPLPNDAQTRLLKMLMLSDYNKSIPMLLETLACFSKASQTKLANALWHEYDRLKMPTKEKWLLLASGFLYHAELGDKVWGFIESWESLSKKRKTSQRNSVKHSLAALAQQAINHPESNTSDDGLRMLLYITQNARDSIQRNAQDQIDRYASVMEISQDNTTQNNDDVYDRIIPTLGLDARGKRVFDFGERHFTVSLDSHLNPQFVDDQGNAFVEQPKAHEKFAYFKKQLAAFIRDDLPRMENMMLKQRCIKAENFMTYYVHNPVMRILSQQLVWGVYDNQRLSQCFRVAEDLTCRDTKDNELACFNDIDSAFWQNKHISIIHPLLLKEEQLATWIEIFTDYDVIQPFEQLGRQHFTLHDDELANNKISRFADQSYDATDLLSLINFGWQPTHNIDRVFEANIVLGFNKKIIGFDIEITLASEFNQDEPEESDPQHIESIEIRKNYDPIDIQKVHPIIISELLRDITLIPVNC